MSDNFGVALVDELVNEAYDGSREIDRWEAFYYHICAQGRCILDLEHSYVAQFRGEKTSDVDSYGYVLDEDIWFVFSLMNERGEVGNFRRRGVYKSWVGRRWTGPTEEVVPKTIEVTEWERV